MPTALITGITGQDGWYLANHLRQLGVEVCGVTRRATAPVELEWTRCWSLPDPLDGARLGQILADARPDEIYHLAAQSSVAQSWDEPATTGVATGIATAVLLDAVHRVHPGARVFVASSSEIFGEPSDAPQDERTPMDPVSPYGAAKAYARSMARSYRARHGLYVSVGILYNHESPRRSPSFVTSKIARGAIAVARGEERVLELGNLDARRDWGFAGDYVRAMRLALQADDPDDYVIATGHTHSVREFCEIAFRKVGLDSQEHVVSVKEFWRPLEPVPLVGDPAKACDVLGWKPTVSFGELVEMMVDAGLQSDLSPT